MTARCITLKVATRDLAHTLAGAIQNLIDPPPAALTLFEAPETGGWRIDAYYDTPPTPQALRENLSNLLDLAPPEIGDVSLDDVPDLNWVALSQAALPPVTAGRYTIHGSHDRHRVPQGPGAILIDAGEAFGTAHHATTYGCLLAIDRLTRSRASCDLSGSFCRGEFGPRSSWPAQGVAGLRSRRTAKRLGQIRPALRVSKRRPPRTSIDLSVAPLRPASLSFWTGAPLEKQNWFRYSARRSNAFRHVLDLGCGSGVLAIAVHRALPHARITATDLDAPSIEVARQNARLNRCTRAIDFHIAPGLNHPALRGQRYDLLIANILADPLIHLARDISQAVVPGGHLILSGLLVPQAPSVIAAYRAAGFHLVEHARIHEWATLTMRRNVRAPRGKQN